MAHRPLRCKPWTVVQLTLRPSTLMHWVLELWKADVQANAQADVQADAQIDAPIDVQFDAQADAPIDA